METWRLNLGYEKQLANEWAASVDFIYAESSNLQSNIELNRTIVGLDSFGRPLYSFSRPQDEFNEIFTRQSVGESEYTALTLKAQKRWNGRYQLQAHYTWSEDRDTDSNERSATSVTVTNPDDIRFDWGLSERDVEHRFLLSGVVLLPWDIKLSGIVELRSGRPYTPTDAFLEGDDHCPFTLGFNCTDILAVIDGQLVERNSARNESVSRVDLRLSKVFKVGNWTIDVFGEAFNLFDENSFDVAFGERQPTLDDGITPNPEFGIPDDLVTDQRQFQIGARISFR